MRNPLLGKCALIALICALLMIPLSMIEHTIEERSSYRAEAVQAIAASSAGEQRVTGPILTVPVQETYDEELPRTDAPGSAKVVVRKTRTHYVDVIPTEVHFKGGMQVEKRAYGLYDTAVFDMQSTLTGTFVLPTEDALPPLGAHAQLVWGQPTLSVGVADPRGIAGTPQVTLGSQPLTVRRGTQTEYFKTGFQATTGTPATGQAISVPFQISLRLAGTASMAFVPVGESSTAELTGNWKHPSFGGDFLPRSREVTAQGFSAQWSTTALASSVQSAQELAHASGFQVRLIEPVDVYQQALRSVKYAVLFVALGFAAFFMFEQIRRLPIHPIQYLLVGLAQAVFFLLLTSLSEHVAFAWAYLAAALASVGLIGVYLSAVLRGWGPAAGFSGGLAMLYAALFGILQSEQNALLLGSLLIFVALAALMLGTRHMDWYQLAQPGKKTEVAS